MALGLSVAAGYTLYRVVHARPTERAVARAFQGMRGTARGVTDGARSGAQAARKAARRAARKARESGMSVGEIFDSSALARGAVGALSRAAMTTVGGMLVGAIIERRRSDEDDKEGKGEEVLFEHKTSAPTAATVRSGPIMG
jgi:hypothetical protein